MTSVSIISGVGARIKYLMNKPTDSESSLLSELESIKQWLKAADLETKEREAFVKLEKQIVQLSYNIGDVIEAKELETQSKSKGKLSRQFGSSFGRPSGTSSSEAADLESLIMKNDPGRLKNDIKLLSKSVRPSGTGSSGAADLESFKKELVRLKNNLEKIMTEKTTPPAGSEMAKKEKKSSSTTSPSHLQENPAITPEVSTGVNLQIRMEKVVREVLSSSRQDLSVVSIWGQSGMGKTTLANKVFCHSQVRASFQGFAWVRIHKECLTKKVLQRILLQLLPNKKADIGGMTEIQLTQEILNFQKKKRCLFVLEDIVTVQDWQSIRVALLLGNSSKILITTTSKDVAEMATSSKDGVFRLKPLTQEECFEILKEKASFDEHELENVGTIIFRLSQGSPLFAVILGKCLKPENATARDQLVLELEKCRRQSSEGIKQVLGLCYHKLSDELKPCLLYMGLFPEGQDIEVEKLHLLLAAEDLIPPEDPGTTKTIFMESIRNILEELAFKELVELQEDKGSMPRMYKSCRLHDQIRDLCISKGLDEEFSEIVDFKSGKKSVISTRRIGIYLSKHKDGNASASISQDMGKKVRSLLIFDTDESQQKSTWPSEINDLKEFSHLRVVDFDGVDFRVRKFPRGMDKLVLLRYLSFRGCWLEAIPSSISKLPCLETLDLRVHTHRKMTIPNFLSNMKRLRHLYFPVLYQSDDNSKLQLSGLEKLEILVNFDTGACDVNNLSQLKNLQILATISEGNHKDLEHIIKYLDDAPANLQSSVVIRNFNCYTTDRVIIFKKLLECKSLHSLDIEGQIGQLPEDVAISPNFTEMHFDGSEIEDDPVNVLGNLPNLRSLVLSNDAFIVDKIIFSDASKFPNLRSLQLQNLQYLEKLEFRKGAMPMLSTLVIQKCDYLEEVSIPEELYNRLQLARGNKGDDVYSVEPLLNITGDTDQV